MLPQAYHPNSVGLFIYQNSGISYPIKAVRFSSPFAHINHFFHWLPRLSAISTTTHSHIDIFLQILAIVVTIVVNGYQRTFISGYKPRYTVAFYAVLFTLTKCNSKTLSFFFSIIERDFCLISGEFYL